MQVTVKMHTRTRERAPGSPDPEHALVRGARLLDARLLEAFLLNIDASLRVHTRAQMFGWTQGMLQNLLRHELLLCALREGRSLHSRVECLASPWIDAERLSQLFQQDVELAADLVQRWGESEFHPVVSGVSGEGALTHGAFSAELNALGTENVMVHGTYDSLGKPVSLFVLAGAAGDLTEEHALLLELIAPYLHLAWMRSQLAHPLEENRAEERAGELLTVREKEILKWIHLGKSNAEIGMILGISPLTVKNHVQKILRKLNVRNRTQAVGRALALRLLET